jgi:hypothetical protein
VDAEIARHGRPPLSFNPCVIEDLSVGGARCRLAGVPTPADLAPDALLQLKFVVPDTTGQCIVMARLTRVAAPDAIGLAFLHITDRDANAVMQFCLQQVRVQAHLPHGSVTDRQQRGAGESES